MTCCVCVLSRFSCVWLCDPMDCSPPGFSVRGVLQARMVEWVAISSSRGSSDPGIEPESLASPPLTGGLFTTSTTWEPMTCWIDLNAQTEASHATQGPVPYSDFRYTDSSEKVDWFFFLYRTRPEMSWGHIPPQSGLHHQSAQPFHTHFSCISSTVILINPSYWWVLSIMPGTDLVLCIHFLN